MPDENYVLGAAVSLLIIFGILYLIVSKKNNARKRLEEAERGEDKRQLQRIMAGLLPGETGCQTAYAYWVEERTVGYDVVNERDITENVYYSYIIAFDASRLWMAPLTRDKQTGELRAGKLSCYTAEDLGRVKLSVYRYKDVLSGVNVTLYDKRGRYLTRFTVSSRSLRNDRNVSVNIFQESECQAFERSIAPLADQVSSENRELEARTEKKRIDGIGTDGAVAAAVGAFACCYAPAFGTVAVGALAALIGLCMTVWAMRKGRERTVPLIMIAAACLALALVRAVAYFK